MRPEIKEFYLLQYRWLRLPYPGSQDVRSRSRPEHPLYQIDLEVSHAEPSVFNLITSILSDSKLFDVDDVYEIINTYENVKLNLNVTDISVDGELYKEYVHETLNLPKKALYVLN